MLRVLTKIAAIAAALTAGSLFGAAVADAHIHVSADHPIQGAHAVVTFEVPNESEKGSAATRVTVGLPNSTSASVAEMPGWAAEFDRVGASGPYRSVTFTADAGAGIRTGHFQLFSIALQLPDTASVIFPVEQNYADGTSVIWDQPRPVNGAEPEHPAPVLELSAGPAQPAELHSTATGPPKGIPITPAPASTGQPTARPASDNTARALAGAALLVAAIGVGVALARRRA